VLDRQPVHEREHLVRGEVRATLEQDVSDLDALMRGRDVVRAKERGRLFPG